MCIELPYPKTTIAVRVVTPHRRSVTCFDAWWVGGNHGGQEAAIICPDHVLFSTFVLYSPRLLRFPGTFLLALESLRVTLMPFTAFAGHVIFDVDADEKATRRRLPVIKLP